MKTVTYGRPASKSPVVKTIKCHADGNITVCPPRERPAESVRCVGCIHFRQDPTVKHMGYERYSCALGHLQNDRHSLRWFIETEVFKPSIQLAAVSRGCRDFSPSLGDVL